MTSKHYRWQLAWTVDADTGTATHTSGLRVRLVPGGQVQADNEAETLAALAVKNGPHNAPQMLARLLREGAQVLTLENRHA